MSEPPRKKKKLTETTKAHRFEPFTKRIAKIKIDPVHTVQKTRVLEDSNDLKQSYFRAALEEWTELNLTSTFTSFLNKVSPLSESLPQILHHADKIFECLLEHIGRKDELALEPLLSLVAHLAHDLGRTFEKYFAATIKLITQVSAGVADPTAIESCFTCLAWIFKFLSRVLVLDLRPLFDIMIPYMSAKQQYMRRFSAESLAFLVRKAASMVPKNAIPLQLALTHLFEHLREGNRKKVEEEAYEYAFMTLLCDSAIGVEYQVHSCAVHLFGCILEIATHFDFGTHQSPETRIIEGSLTRLIHQTTANGFSPLLKLLLEKIVDNKQHSSLSMLNARLLSVIIGTRKGSRISDWSQCVEAALAATKTLVSDTEDSRLVQLSIYAGILQYAPMDQLMPYLRKLLDQVTIQLSSTAFFSLCEIVSSVGKDRFIDLLLPSLQQYILDRWETNETTCSYLFSQLRNKQASSLRPGKPGYLALPKSWEKKISNDFRIASKRRDLPVELSQNFQLMRSVHFPREKATATELSTCLLSLIKDVLQREDPQLSMASRLTLGWATQCYLSLEEPDLLALWRHVLQQRQDAFTLLPFLDCVLALCHLSDEEIFSTVDATVLLDPLVHNMLSENVELRKRTISILAFIAQRRGDSWLVESTELLSNILDIAYSPSSVRQIAMLVRKLSSRQAQIDTQSPLHPLIPLFALGMMRHYHDQTRKDLCGALSEMVVTGHAEETIFQVVLKWLQIPGSAQDLPETSKTKDTIRLSPFQCSNLLMLQELASETYGRYSSAGNLMREDFEQNHQLLPPRTPINSRALALEVLAAMVETAERRSRLLTPIFLAMTDGKLNHHIPHSDESTSSHTISPEVDEQPWNLRDRKAFLELMSTFVNPRVLYRSSEVYKVLLELLTNGNPDIRKLSLTAILRWKESALLKYEDVLLRIAAEKAASTELSVLLSNNGDVGSILPADRQVVIPVVLRLIFGLLVGRSSNHGPEEAKRKSILRLLFRINEEETRLFLDITVGRLGEVTLLDNRFPEHVLSTDLVSPDQQFGFLRMMHSMMDTLQSSFTPYGEKVVAAVLYCTARACRKVHTSEEIAETSVTGLTRSVRKTGIQNLALLFELCPQLNWVPYVPTIFSEIISPKLANFANENAQGVSAMLRLVAKWAKYAELLPFLLRHDEKLLEHLSDTIHSENVRDEVRLFVLEEIFIPITIWASDSSIDSSVAIAILSSCTDNVLEATGAVLTREPGKDVLVAVTRLIPMLVQHCTSSSTARQVLDLLITLLCQPNQRIPPHVKGNLLTATYSLLQIETQGLPTEAYEKLYEVVATLYNYFKDQPNRETLGKILKRLSEGKDYLRGALQISEDLNAVSRVRLDEVNFDKRLAAFLQVNELEPSEGSREFWLPIVCNLVYFARTADDFALRSNAVSSIKRFVSLACQSGNTEAHGLVSDTLLPIFRKGTREDSEVIRADFVALFGLVVKHLKGATNLQDMKILLVGDDDEASFFANILHIQQHRRIRAIRRLVNETEQGQIKANNIADFFIPLLEKFIYDESGDESAQGTKGQSIAAVSDLLKWVDWKAFRRSFRQYRNDLDSAVRSEKDTIKLLNNAADALTTVMQYKPSSIGTADIKPSLLSTLAPNDTIWRELKTGFIPRLAKFIHLKEESEISLRIPAAKVAVKLIKLLPEDEISHLVSPILLDISQILRSRTQESRDIARNTLADIVVLIGPSSVQFVLKELRATLSRGYQLHVLSYTMHTILVNSAPHNRSGDLDYCIDELVAVVMDDIFGIAGQEKENQEYISSMKEVKSSKSFDSMEHLAKITSVQALSKLIKPFQALLMGHLTTKQLRHVDELFRRVGVGISHNPLATSQDLLVFAYELIQTFYKEKAALPPRAMTNDEKNRKQYLVQLDSAEKRTSSTGSSLVYKLARFALDIVRSALVKNASLATAENVHGFLPVIGDALISGQEDVKISASRLLSAIIRLPINELDQNAATYVMEAVKIIKGSVSTKDEIAQAALKLVAAILRERRDVKVRESDVAYLLHRTMPDLDEPDRQGVTFNFIKAVMLRKYELPEVYELVDKLAAMMVTNQTRNTRDAARGVYVHFLLEYPQTRGRWSKQLKFLVKNLEYQYPEGRQSVMEAIYNLVQKLDDETTQELVSTFFVPVVLRIANDEQAACRELAGVLLSQLYRKADSSQLNALLEPLRGWINQDENTVLAKVGAQAWSIFFEVDPAGADVETAHVRAAIVRVLQKDFTLDEEWDLQYQMLELLQKLVASYPAIMMTQKQHHLWAMVFAKLNSPHRWIQMSATSLLSVYLHDCLSHASLMPPIVGSHGLKFDADAVVSVLRSLLQVLRRNEDSQELADRVLPNLLFLGKYVDAHGLKVEVKVRSNAAVDANGSVSQDSDSAEHSSEDEDDEDDEDEDENHVPRKEMRSLAASQYLLHQLSSILRREPNKYTTLSFVPRLSALSLLSSLIPGLQVSSLTDPSTTTTNIITPLTYITSTNIQTPRSIDPTFAQTHETYTTQAHEVLTALQTKLGDQVYTKLLTQASRAAQEKQQDRRQKRAIERVAQPERAARNKRKKVEREKERKKLVADLYRKGRRRDLGF